MYQFIVTLANGDEVCVMARCERDVWADFGDTAISVECVG